MKKLLIWVLVLAMLLAGCTTPDKPEETTTTTNPSATEKPPVEEIPAEPFAQLYDPSNAVETVTNGAVKGYTLPVDTHAELRFVGDGILLLSGGDDPLLTYIKPDGSTSQLSLMKGFYLSMDFFTVLHEEQIVYFDSDNNELVYMDLDLKEADRLKLPNTMSSTPEIAPDGSRIYYFTDTELRYLDVQTGTDRLLKEMSYPMQDFRGIHFDGTVLDCIVSEGEEPTAVMISAKTGEMLYSGTDMPWVHTSGDWYFAQHDDNTIVQYLYGIRGKKIYSLNVDRTVCLEVPEKQAVVTWDETENGFELEYYDLSSGLRSAAVTLPAEYAPATMTADPKENAIWLVGLNSDDEPSLYRWDLSLSQTEDTASYVTPYYTVDNPDTEGLKQIERQAQELGMRFGVRIRVYEDALAVQPSDYSLELEYKVPVYQRYLAELEKALSNYPDGLLRKLGNSSGNGKITISLVRAAYGDNALGSLDSADGLHFYHNGNVYLALVMNDNFLGTLYHELFHTMDTYVLNHSIIYDNWDQLNPEGFEYDNDYIANQFREDYQYLEEDRWFIDMYAMSYAKEDRARIMEFAMQQGNEEFFASEHMQKKLATLCLGIRTAFGLKSHSGVLAWEQYLK